MLVASGVPQVALLLIILAVAGSLGALLVSRLSLELGKLEGAIFSVALGLGILSYLTFLLGLLQLYYSWLFKPALAVGVLWFISGWIQRLKSFTTKSTKLAKDFVSITATVLLALFGVLYLLAALAPEIEFDALNYHLGIPRLYLAHHGICALPNTFYSNFPLMLEMLFTFGCLVGSELLAKLLHFSFAVLTVIAIVAFCNRYLVKTAGLLAALLFLASPIVGFSSSTANVDLGLAFFIFLSLYSFYNWIRTRSGGWLILAAICSGLALGTKYTGTLALVLITLTFGYFWLRQSIAVGPLLRYYAVVFIVFLPWVLKNVVLTGNPIAPLLSDVFYNPHFQPRDYEIWMGVMSDWAGYEANFWNYLRSPVLLTFHPDRFAGTPGLVYIFFFPLAGALNVGAALRAAQSRSQTGRYNLAGEVRTLAFVTAVAVLGYIFLIFGTRQVRFYIPLFPFISIAIAGAFCSGGLAKPFARFPGLVLLFSLVILQLPYFSSLWGGTGGLMLRGEAIGLFKSEQEREEYLEMHLHGTNTLEFYRYMEQNLPPEEPVLALSIAYQSMTNHPLLMSPNGSAANELSNQILMSSLQPEQVNPENLSKSFRDQRVHYLFYVLEPQLTFVHNFFQSPAAQDHFKLIDQIGDYYLYSLSPLRGLRER